jgi:short-subunit dehydrogenase
MARSKRSALITTSSVLGVVPTPGLVAYSSSKASASYFTEALSYEVQDKIDVMAWNCGPVNTKANCFDGDK